MKIPGAYSQRDGRWGSQLLGYNTDASFNIANYGCAITGVANMLWCMGHPDMNPAVVNNTLKDRSGFVSGGLLVWGAVNGLASDLRSQGISTNLNDVNNFLKAEGNFAIIQVTKPGFPMHFITGVFPGQSIDAWDGVLKATTSYQFVSAHLYGDVTPDFVTSPAPAVAPAVVAPKPDISFNPLNQNVTVVVDDLEVRTGPGTEYPGNQANTADHDIHNGQVIHVTGFVEDDVTITLDNRSSNKWLRTNTNPAHWFAAAGTNYVAETAAPAPIPVPVPEPTPAPAAEPVIEAPVEAEKPAEPVAPIPDPEVTTVATHSETPVAEVLPLKPPVVKVAQKVVYISDIESGKHIEKVPAGIPFTFIVQVNKNGVQYGVTQNMLNTDPVHGVDLAQFNPQVQDITPPSTLPANPPKDVAHKILAGVDAEIKEQGKVWQIGTKLLHNLHKEK